MSGVLRVVAIFLAVVMVVLLVGVLGFKLFDYIRAAEFYNNAEAIFKTPGVSDSAFVPQGMTYIESTKTFLITGYMSDGSAARVYAVNDDGSVTYTKLLNADGTEYTDHTGGIEYFDSYVYITGEDSHGLDTFPAEDILSGKETARQLGTVSTYNSPAHCYVWGDYIITGAFHRDGSVYITPAHERLETVNGYKNTSMMTVFKLDANAELGIDPTPVALISAREMVQGICITPEEQMVISTSWGFNSSELFFYDLSKTYKIDDYHYEGTITVGEEEKAFDFTLPCYVLDDNNEDCLVDVVTAPPMSEELVCLDGRIIVNCESACNKYIFGKLTTGFSIWGYEYNK